MPGLSELEPLSDYFVEISRDADGLWRWEIKRRSRPLGVRLYNSGFRTPAEAQLAGEQFLKNFLDAIGRETDGD
jgi:hypothetical protein